MITVNDAVRGVAVLENQIDISAIRMQEAPLNEEFWIQSQGKENTNGPKLKISLNWRENDIYKFKKEQEMWDEQIRSDVTYYN